MRKIRVLLVSTTQHDNAIALTKILQTNGYDCLHIQSLNTLELVNHSFRPDIVVFAHHETQGQDFTILNKRFGGLIPIIALMWMPGLLQQDLIRYVHSGILQINSLDDPRILRTIEAETKQVRDDLDYIIKH